MKQQFNEIKVTVPSLDEYRARFEKLQAQLENGDETTSIKTVAEYFALNDELETNISIIFIHFTQDTTNEEYSKAQDKLDEITPYFSEMSSKFEKALLASPHKDALIREYGKLYFDELELQQKTFDSKIIPDLQKENTLTSEYSRVISRAKIEFRGEKYNLSQLGKFCTSSDRETRKEASKASWGYFQENDEEIGRIYDELVKVRTKIAHDLGFKSFTELGYARLGRLDYTAKEVEAYREKIAKYVTPLATTYRMKIMERLGIKDPQYYDFSMCFVDGNAVPCGDSKKLIDEAEKLYHEMSPKVGPYFTSLKENGMLDLVARPGKQGGGYECYLPGLKSPFIFSNFNGTEADIGVLTHEFGHALQAFLGSDIKVPAYRSPSMECCEMHSMSMEFLAYPYLLHFFDEVNEKKYRYKHLLDALFFLPYGASVDELQHEVYAHPEWTPEERKACYRRIQQKYLPHLKYEGVNEFLNSGGYWYRQSHIFSSPFYYIDYTIAQVVSFEFLVESKKDYNKALEKYLAFCKLGGQYPYHELLKKGGIDDPMEGNTIANLIDQIKVIIETQSKEVE